MWTPGGLSGLHLLAELNYEGQRGNGAITNYAYTGDLMVLVLFSVAVIKHPEGRKQQKGGFYLFILAHSWSSSPSWWGRQGSRSSRKLVTWFL